MQELIKKHTLENIKTDSSNFISTNEKNTNSFYWYFFGKEAAQERIEKEFRTEEKKPLIPNSAKDINYKTFKA